MTTIELVKEVSIETGVSSHDVHKVVDCAFKKIKGAVIRGEGFYNRGFGSFNRVERKAKKARNISQKTTISIPAHFAPAFKPSPKFKEAVAK